MYEKQYNVTDRCDELQSRQLEFTNFFNEERWYSHRRGMENRSISKDLYI